MIHINFKFHRLKEGKSEDSFASRAGISRITLRQIESSTGNPTLNSLDQLAKSSGKELCLYLIPENSLMKSEFSVVAVSLKVLQDGKQSWPFHFMELVDHFRKSEDFRLFLLPPVEALSKELRALLSSIVCMLCEEMGLSAPAWAQQTQFLESPWFISETESLKAMAIKESPLFFRRNNIFVHDNFLQRA